MDIIWYGGEVLQHVLQGGWCCKADSDARRMQRVATCRRAGSVARQAGSVARRAGSVARHGQERIT